eukprot:928272-Rhodomonas_salina.1
MEGAGDAEEEAVRAAKIDVILKQFVQAASQSKVRSLVLGAWGCGAFGNDARNVGRFSPTVCRIEIPGTYKDAAATRSQPYFGGESSTGSAQIEARLGPRREIFAREGSISDCESCLRCTGGRTLLRSKRHFSPADPKCLPEPKYGVGGAHVATNATQTAEFTSGRLGLLLEELDPLVGCVDELVIPQHTSVPAACDSMLHFNIPYCSTISWQRHRARQSVIAHRSVARYTVDVSQYEHGSDCTQGKNGASTHAQLQHTDFFVVLNSLLRRELEKDSPRSGRACGLRMHARANDIRLRIYRTGTRRRISTSRRRIDESGEETRLHPNP